MGQAQGEARHRRGVGAPVVVEDDEHRFAGVPQVVERLVGHSPGECAVTDDRHHPTLTALELERTGQTVGVAEDGRGVAVLDPVVFGLGPIGITRQSIGLSELGEGCATARHQFVDVGLVPGVPQQYVPRGVEGPMEGQSELDHTQVGAEVPPGDSDGVDDERTDFGSQKAQAPRL